MVTARSRRVRILAERVVALAADEVPPGSGFDVVGVRLFERLRAQTGTWLGPDGFRALYARALDLAGAEYAFLLGGPPAPLVGEPTPAGLRACLADHNPDENRRCLVSLVTHFVGLLAELIGPDLVLLHLRRTWPPLETQDVPRRDEEEQS